MTTRLAFLFPIKNPSFATVPSRDLFSMKVLQALCVFIAGLTLVAGAPAGEDKHLVSTKPGEVISVTEQELEKLIRSGKKFFDLTGQSKRPLPRAQKVVAFPSQPQFQQEVKKYNGLLNRNNLKSNLEKLSSFYTRYYRSQTGVQSAQWIFDKATEIANSTSGGAKVSVKKFQHSWPQFSVIARIEGSNPALKDIVVVGAHQDSINQNNPQNGRAPGADDDGSGSITILESLRTLVAGGFAPKRSVEFQWYAAEEVGLRGSQDIANRYQSSGVQVRAMLQQDMTGYPGNTRAVGIITDYVDSALTGFLRKLVTAYCSIRWVNTECGYACSDHASFTEAGFPSSFAFESTFDDSNPYIHTAQDTTDYVDYNHMLEFAKLVNGFAVELANSN
ncbi:uncharacterized protein VTP21DRAFT_4507 [Calcarisporiella thermophila]|uniref:uncharacterized protein n=1 Tax=Calcarisporiella thermophila TaxID=911321 RepID=UPI00374335B1